MEKIAAAVDLVGEAAGAAGAAGAPSRSPLPTLAPPPPSAHPRPPTEKETGTQVVPVFLTVDPERDGVKEVAE